VTAQIARGRNGVVSAGHGLASEAAITVLRAGGNAVDAAIAAALVLAVVCPYAVSLAGDLYALIYEPKNGTVAGLNATGASPASATRERFADGIPSTGILSSTVPGMLRGLEDLGRRFGTLSLAALLPPALRLAEEGFPVHRQLAANAADRVELLAKNPAARALFLPGGKPLEEHTHFRQPDLAAVLRAIASDGVESFYRGEIARLMVQAAQAAGGLFSAEDFAAHQSLWQEPIAAPFYGHDVLTMPPNSFGATLLWQLLALEAGKIDRVDPDSADFVLQGYEARRSAYRAVARLIADPRQTEAKLRRALIEAVSGDVSRAAQPEPAEARDRCTTCVAVIDRGGMAVSLIESVSAPYGAGVVLDGTGILLNNRMAGFNVDADSDNCVAPGKRPANTLAPCLVMKDGKLVMSVGTPGTVGQTCTLAQFLARVLACGEDPAAAASVPRWSVDFQGKLVVEDTMAPALREAVQARAPEARAMREGWISFGSIKLAANTPDGLFGIADHRRVAPAQAW
jgi:gamma-glutamyltranspeptidase / glutathione hydrolase